MMALKRRRATSPSSSVSGGDFEDSQTSSLSSTGRKRRRISNIPTVDPVMFCFLYARQVVVGGGGRGGCFSVFDRCLPDRRVPRAVQHYQGLQRRAGPDAVWAVHQSAQETVRTERRVKERRETSRQEKLQVSGLLQEPAGLLPRGVSAHWHDEDPAEAEDGGVRRRGAAHRRLSASVQQRKEILQGESLESQAWTCALTCVNVRLLSVSSRTAPSTGRPANSGTFTCAPRMNLSSEETLMRMTKMRTTRMAILEAPLRMRWRFECRMTNVGSPQ